jgi:hypothetical protein
VVDGFLMLILSEGFLGMGHDVVHERDNDIVPVERGGGPRSTAEMGGVDADDGAGDTAFSSPPVSVRSWLGMSGALSARSLAGKPTRRMRAARSPSEQVCSV